MKDRSVLALTMGDPAGVGPEIAVRCATDPQLQTLADMIVYGAPDVISVAVAKFAPDAKPPTIKRTGALTFDAVPVGEIDAACGLAARDAVIAAAQDAIGGVVDGMVTAPMNKASVNRAGVPFTGHTELIADLCETRDFAMMQSAGDLRVAFATTHVALRDVHQFIDEERIVKVARLLKEAVQAEGIDKPKLAAAALNPHAGENGHMGTEDETIVKPALNRLRNDGVNIEGPFPPDTLFIEKIRTRFDGILSMYHDQGHIPFKMLAFDRGVNSTLGLPIIRTSVDHGTAFEIAWRGVADLGSMAAAIKLAARRAGH